MANPVPPDSALEAAARRLERACAALEGRWTGQQVAQRQQDGGGDTLFAGDEAHLAQQLDAAHRRERALAEAGAVASAALGRAIEEVRAALAEEPEAPAEAAAEAETGDESIAPELTGDAELDVPASPDEDADPEAGEAAGGLDDPEQTPLFAWTDPPVSQLPQSDSMPDTPPPDGPDLNAAPPAPAPPEPLSEAPAAELEPAPEQASDPAADGDQPPTPPKEA